MPKTFLSCHRYGIKKDLYLAGDSSRSRYGNAAIGWKHRQIWYSQLKMKNKNVLKDMKETSIMACTSHVDKLLPRVRYGLFSCSSTRKEHISMLWSCHINGSQAPHKWRYKWRVRSVHTYCSLDAMFLLLKYGGAAAVPPRVELNGNGRRPLNPSSIHRTCSTKPGTKNDEGKRCHSLPTQSTEPAYKEINHIWLRCYTTWYICPLKVVSVYFFWVVWHIAKAVQN